MPGIKDFHSPIDIALQSLAAANIDITAQTLSTVKNDWRFGTANFSSDESSFSTGTTDLIEITGKGILFNGRWATVFDTPSDMEAYDGAFSYIIDGGEHSFEDFRKGRSRGWTNGGSYHPSMEVYEPTDGITAGFLPGVVTFESSFTLRFASTLTADLTLTTAVLYAIAL